MTYLDSIILGIVEGLTEFIPVSSTGHLILTSTLLGLTQTEALKSFEIAIQLGAILAVVVLYWRSFLNWNLLKHIAVAFVPTALVGFVLYHFIKDALIGNVGVVLWALLLGGIGILVVEWLTRKHAQAAGSATDLSYLQAFFVGLAQAVAVIPGVSRSGATAMGGLLAGVPRAAIMEFSFLLAVPTMVAATGYDLVKDPSALAGSNLGLLATGFVVSFLVAMPIVKYALSFVRQYSFVPFALYRIALALVFFFIFYS